MSMKKNVVLTLLLFCADKEAAQNKTGNLFSMVKT